MNGGASAEGKNRVSDFNNECSNDSSLKVTRVATGVEVVELCQQPDDNSNSRCSKCDSN